MFVKIVDGISFTDTILIHEFPSATDIEMPNVFTPNNDGLNELFKPMHSEHNLYTIFMYNRWGTLIHETNTGWDGTNLKNTEKEEGVYYYVIEYQNECTKSRILKKSGYVARSH